MDHNAFATADLKRELEQRLKALEQSLAGSLAKMVEMDVSLENQEHTIREQEKDIVTLKLQVQGLLDHNHQVQIDPWNRPYKFTAGPNCVSKPVPTVSETDTTDTF